LPFFRGPLDLLLHLIQERELEITKISLAQVTDQYLAYVSHLERLEVETLADFIVVAAQLLLIKSRALLPQPPAGEFGEEEEMGDELIRRLIEYQKFKAAAQQLRSREEEGLRAYPQAITVQPRPPFPLEGVSLNDLVEVLRQALQEQPVGSVGEIVAPLTISLPAKIRELERLVLRRRRSNLNRLLRRAKSRLEIIVTFLALLQLIKRRKIAIQQDRPFGEITIFAI
ncbi:MAG: segregation and condensation protein A, partial [Anaerolineae bacterium]